MVSDESLRKYHDYLKDRLVLPLPGRVHSDVAGDERERVTLVGLVPVEDHDRVGLIAEIRRGGAEDFLPLWTLSVDQPGAARQLVEDYALWFWSYSPLNDPEGAGFLPGTGNPVWSLVKAATGYGAAFGATTGALLATDDRTFWGMYVGMAVLGLVGAVAGSRYGLLFGAINGMRFGQLYGAIFGIMAGVLIGSAVGVMVMGAVGTIPGAIAGSLLGALMPRACGGSRSTAAPGRRSGPVSGALSGRRGPTGRMRSPGR